MKCCVKLRVRGNQLLDDSLSICRVNISIAMYCKYYIHICDARKTWLFEIFPSLHKS